MPSLLILLLLGTLWLPLKCLHQADLTDCSTGPGPPFLITDLYGGLNNQRWGLLTGLLYAHQHNLTYVVPPHVLLDALNQSCPAFHAPRPIGSLYHLPHFSRTAARYGVPVVVDWDAARQARCCGVVPLNNFREPLQLGQSGRCFDAHRTFTTMRTHLRTSLRFEGFADDPWTRKWGRPSPHLFYVLNPEFQPWRHALTPAPALRTALADVERDFRALIGPGPYAVVHARLEGDMKWMEKVWRGYFMMPEKELTRRLLQEFGLPRGYRLHVCSGLSAAELPILCGTFRCFQLRQLRLPRVIFGDCPTDRLPRDLLAFFDFHVALRGADAFYGHLHSSFSVELYMEFIARGKAAHFVNWNGRREV